MYGVVNEQSKEKEQSAVSKNSPTMSMMKIDPQTLSPIVSNPNSPIVSPPPYSPTARSYQNSPFTRDICRNSNSPISPRNSPVNMLSTNPFIPSHTPNTNPRLIYSHFPPAFTDTSRFSNPLIRSPIGVPPPSAFHSSLPPSINKLYQRSGYMTQPQTSVATGFTPGVAGQPLPAVQRIPPSSHASPSPASSSSSPASSKSPKTSSASPSSGAGSASVHLARSEALTATSATPVSMVDSVALHLAKSLAQRDANAYDLTRAESQKLSAEHAGVTKQISVAPTQQQSHSANSKSNDTSTKSKLPSSAESPKAASETSSRQNDASAVNKKLQSEAKSATVSAAASAIPSKEIDKKDKSSAKVNGGISITMASNEKSKEQEVGSQQQNKDEKSTGSKSTSEEADRSKQSSSPAKSSFSKAIAAQEPNKTEIKQTAAGQQKQENDTADSVKAADVTVQGKKITDTQKSKAES